jgi:uncharacterized protein YlxP (DUF503 family)
MLRFTLRLRGSGSLKDKRQVVRSVTQRVRNKFGAAVAEVGENEAWQLAEIGVACVSNSRAHAQQMLDEVVAYVEESRLDAEVMHVESDVMEFE